MKRSNKYGILCVLGFVITMIGSRMIFPDAPGIYKQIFPIGIVLVCVGSSMLVIFGFAMNIRSDRENKKKSRIEELAGVTDGK